VKTRVQLQEIENPPLFLVTLAKVSNSDSSFISPVLVSLRRQRNNRWIWLTFRTFLLFLFLALVHSLVETRPELRVVAGLFRHLRNSTSIGLFTVT
jgi:hypothetical protein